MYYKLSKIINRMNDVFRQLPDSGVIKDKTGALTENKGVPVHVMKHEKNGFNVLTISVLDEDLVLPIDAKFGYREFVDMTDKVIRDEIVPLIKDNIFRTFIVDFVFEDEKIIDSIYQLYNLTLVMGVELIISSAMFAGTDGPTAYSFIKRNGDSIASIGVATGVSIKEVDNLISELVYI